MYTHILLLRSDKVSGANIVKMADFRTFLAGLGFENVETYIESGNAVFSLHNSVDEAHRLISQTFPARFGILPKTMLLTGEELAVAIAAMRSRAETSTRQIGPVACPQPAQTWQPIRSPLAANNPGHRNVIPG
jgi:uncharacterized protein (DUF1697 family)